MADEALIENDRFDWQPTRLMVGKIVRFGNGAIGTVIVPAPPKRDQPGSYEDVRVIQFMDPEGRIDFRFVENLGFAHDYDMCYDCELEPREHPPGRLMRMLNRQVEDGDKFKLIGQLFATMAKVKNRIRGDDDVWNDFRKIFPANKREP